MRQRTSKHRFGRQSTRRRDRGFTLLELAVTLTVILLAATMVVPSVAKMLASSADTEAFNLVAAQLTAARAEAVSGATYAGIHVQLGAPQKMSDQAYSMVIQYDEGSGVFRRPANFFPHRVPGKMAFGELSASFIQTALPTAQNPNPPSTYRNLRDQFLPDFCAFSVIFSPYGSVVSKVNNASIRFDPNDAMFNSSNNDTYLWAFAVANEQAGEEGISAFTMFDYAELSTRDQGGRAQYLNDNGQFMPVNMHTGQLFDRQ